MTDALAQWKFMADEAKAGRLDLDPSVSQDCLKACEDQLDVYRSARELLAQASKVSGFGDFPAADELAKMFELKVAGGPGDFDSALKAHIDVLEQIRDTIKYSVDRLVDHDRQQAQAISQHGQ